jgi:hypothetical protein
MNENTFHGNVGNAPRINHSQRTGTAVVTFSIAINSRRFDRDKGHWVTRPKVERTAASSPPTRASAAPPRSRSADPPLGRGPALRGRATRPSRSKEPRVIGAGQAPAEDGAKALNWS